VLVLGSVLMALQLTAIAPAAERAATLTILVKDVSKKGGDVRLGLYDRESWGNDKSEPLAGAVVPALTPETVIVLRNLKPGVYGAKLFQDFNRNGEFDFTWLHLPAEKYGFSRDARVFVHKPDFDATEFTLVPGANTITVHLR
jgi:uncharacterized protein (DUF2141 family)